MHTVLLVGATTKLVKQRKEAFEASGYRVCIARDEDEAFRLVDAKRCDLVVIGVAMDEQHRTILARELKARRPHVKVICLYLGSIRNVEAADAVLQVTSGEQDLVHAARFLFEKARGESGCA
jgi:DNA-binding NtrC family response regulator